MKLGIFTIACLFSSAVTAAEIPTAGYVYGSTQQCGRTDFVVAPSGVRRPGLACSPISSDANSAVLDCQTSFGHYQMSAIVTFDADGDIIYFDNGEEKKTLYRC